jgi:sec-independent protein translocase protein TatB
MLRAMFGMGGTEIIVILIVALLFLGPDKLPEAARQISKGIRDIKKQSRVLQRTIEDDEHIGGAIRDLRSALRGEDEPIRPRPIQPKEIEASPTPDAIGAVAAAVVQSGLPAGEGDASANHAHPDDGPNIFDVDAGHGSNADALEGGHMAAPVAVSNAERGAAAAADAADVAPRLTLPPTAGEADPGATASGGDAAELAALVKPAPNTIARGAAPAASPAPAPSEPSEPSEPKHG